PVAGAGVGVAAARLRRVVERHPRQPALEVRPGAFDHLPELGAVGGVDRREPSPFGPDRFRAHRGARGYRKSASLWHGVPAGLLSCSRPKPRRAQIWQPHKLAKKWTTDRARLHPQLLGTAEGPSPIPPPSGPRSR